MAAVEGPHGGRPLLTAGAPTSRGRSGGAEVAVILLHGRGATAQGVINLFDPVYRHGVTFLAPAAERGRWFPRSFDAPVGTNEPHLTSAVGCVGFALDRAEDAGIPPEKTLIVGFSQGACVAAEFAARRPGRYGGVFVCAGALPGADISGRTVAADGLDGTPVFFGVSDDDPHVSVERVMASSRVFESAGADATVDVANGEGHAVTAASFAAVEDRIAALIGPRR